MSFKKYASTNRLSEAIVGILIPASFFLVYLKYLSPNSLLNFLAKENSAAADTCNTIDFYLTEVLVYSHIPLAATMMIVAIFVYYNNKNNILSRTALTLANIFSFWIFANLASWLLYKKPALFVLAQSQIDLLAILLFVYLFFFTYEYLNGERLDWKVKVLFLLPVVPVAMYLAPNFIDRYDFYSCTITASSLYLASVFALKIFYVSLTALYLVWKYITDSTKRMEVPILGVALLMCFYSFVLANLLADVAHNLNYHIFGLLPLVIFVALFTILIVRYTGFRISVAGANVIIIFLVSFVAIKIFFFTTYSDLAIDITSTFIAVAFSYMLLKNIKREHEQKAEIEQLANKLSKANNKLKELDKMKSEFVSIASHQLRTPITTIRGYIELLQDGTYGKVTKKMSQVLSNIDESSYNMAVSIEDYLNVSRIEAGNMRYVKTDFNMKDLVKLTVDNLKREATRANLLLTFRSELSSGGIVHADKGKIRQVLNNLIDNAIKYTKEGSIEVVIRDKKRPKKIYVDITDTGIGIDPSMLGEVFKKFERAHNAENKNLEGTGLGLFIAKKIMNESGGDISVSSAGEGKGSTFTLELPLKN